MVTDCELCTPMFSLCRYGEDAGKFAGNAMGTGVNTFLAVGMVSNLGARTVARSAVKQYAREREGSAEEAENKPPEEEEEEGERGKTQEGKQWQAVDEVEQVYFSKQGRQGYSLYPEGTAPPRPANSSRNQQQPGTMTHGGCRSLDPPGSDHMDTV